MQATTVTEVSPSELIGMIEAKVREVLLSMQPVQDRDILLTKKQAMDFLQIDSEKGFAAWCRREKVFGKRTGKGNMYLESQILATFKNK